MYWSREFQSTLPLRGATNVFGALFPRAKFQSTLPLRGATTVFWRQYQREHISIHAPLTGSDIMGDGGVIAKVISIHAPLTGSDLKLASMGKAIAISIHAPLTGSDLLHAEPKIPAIHFNPRSPYGERLWIKLWTMIYRKFQSTLPLRGATPQSLMRREWLSISIHAPLTGSDRGGTRCVCRPVYFNPRSPYGERRIGHR